MAKRIARPTTLYKYMAFSERLIEQVCSSRVYFSDPSNFNDPLDCQPVVVADLETEELELLLARLVQARSMKEIAAALRRVRLKGLGATARKVAVSDSEARELIGEINHYATDPEVDDPNVYVRAALCRRIGIRAHDRVHPLPLHEDLHLRFILRRLEVYGHRGGCQHRRGCQDSRSLVTKEWRDEVS